MDKPCCIPCDPNFGGGGKVPRAREFGLLLLPRSTDGSARLLGIAWFKAQGHKQVPRIGGNDGSLRAFQRPILPSNQIRAAPGIPDPLVRADGSRSKLRAHHEGVRVPCPCEQQKRPARSRNDAVAFDG